MFTVNIKDIRTTPTKGKTYLNKPVVKSGRRSGVFI